MKMELRRVRAISLFWSHVDKKKPNECWVWTGCLTEKGYGHVRFLGKDWKASRLAWMLTKEDPGAFYVCHHCDNPACCNPEHLFLGTAKDNIQDMVKKGRHPRNKTGYLPSGNNHHSRLHPEVMARGEQNGAAVLTEAKVLEILRLRSEGMSLQCMARRFNVSKGTIVFIIQRKTWRHVSISNDAGRFGKC
jgi:hypothetical protein